MVGHRAEVMDLKRRDGCQLVFLAATWSAQHFSAHCFLHFFDYRFAVRLGNAFHGSNVRLVDMYRWRKYALPTARKWSAVALRCMRFGYRVGCWVVVSSRGDLVLMVLFGEHLAVCWQAS